MLIKRRFFNTKVKIVTAVMTVSVLVGGALFTLPMDNAKGAGSPYPPTDSENWNPEPVWRDEFNGNSLDDTKWDYYTGGWKDENQQVQNCYKRESENVNVSGGSLNLIGLYKPGATCTGNTKTGDFTSGFVQTKGKANFKYGYIEARIKMPKNKSTWPGFWMSLLISSMETGLIVAKLTSWKPKALIQNLLLLTHTGESKVRHLEFQDLTEVDSV